MSISKLKDIDREILSKLEDKELLKVCSIDKYTWNKVCDDDFLRRRLITKYPDIEQYKKVGESWKQFFLRAVHYIALMKEEHDFIYTTGDFEKQNRIIKIDNYNWRLIISSQEGELPLVIWALKKGIKMGLNTALKDASQYGHYDVVKYLVEYGANIHFNNDEALILASKEGHEKIVKYLVEKGANVNAQDSLPLDMASEYGHYEIVKYLIDKGAIIKDYAVRWACGRGHYEIAKYLIYRGGNIHSEDEFALRMAIYNGRTDMAKYLVDLGADVNAKNGDPLKRAVENKDIEIVKYLVEHGAIITPEILQNAVRTENILNYLKSI